MQPEDWEFVRAIYLEGIATGNATFETSAPAWEDWDRAHLRICRFVARWNRDIVGWAALRGYSGRCAYSGVAEASLYVAGTARRSGVGSALMRGLIDNSERNGIWTIQAGIFPENAASIELCRRFGFRVVGKRERLGQLGGCWRDVLLLERRSTVI